MGGADHFGWQSWPERRQDKVPISGGRSWHHSRQQKGTETGYKPRVQPMHISQWNEREVCRSTFVQALKITSRLGAKGWCLKMKVELGLELGLRTVDEAKEEFSHSNKPGQYRDILQLTGCRNGYCICIMA